MIYNIFIWKPFLFQLQQHIKHWAKPANLSLISGVLSDLTRSRADLIVENALLRQQLIVLNRISITTRVSEQEVKIENEIGIGYME
jgi:hypothetical protein